MFRTVTVVGRGRVGAAIAARLCERGVRVCAEDGELVLLCVPDAAIARVASAIPVGPWIAHVSGATPLAALAPHAHRFSVHPLQTFTRRRGAEQLDGSWAAVTADCESGRQRAMWLAETLGLQPFEISDTARALYHAAAVIASNYVVTLQRSAAHLFDLVGAPPTALTPLIRRVIENGFELTGPIARGDRDTVERHIRALSHSAPELEPMYRALAAATLPDHATL